ncbi:hypothetical protein GQX73_g4279 [Xylaria multiplex]|uniref:Uncharacterized protein n=1 Tax=Xylaria multiplex TaxID=323545 RepID=A0A7C8MZC1_9PEZI|nr:hypothetical protein GQX73_g4279 [Xylaria multiplex]
MSTNQGGANLRRKVYCIKTPSENPQYVYSDGYKNFYRLDPASSTDFDLCFEVRCDALYHVEIVIKSPYLNKILEEVIALQPQRLQDRVSSGEVLSPELQRFHDEGYLWDITVMHLSRLYDRGSIDLTSLLPYYPMLKAYMNHNSDAEDTLRELRLLVQDCLMEPSIFQGPRFESPREYHTITPEHLRDIQSRSIRYNLDNLERRMESYPDPTPRPKDDVLAPELRSAIKKRDRDAVTSIAESMGSVDARSLCMAIKFYDPVIFPHLVKCGSNSTVDGDKYNEPLYCASKLGRLDAVKALVEKGANVDGQPDSLLELRGLRGCPLAGAASQGHFDILLYLIDKGADINGKGYHSPISRALKHGHLGIMNHLIGRGAKISTVAKEYLTSLSRAPNSSKSLMIRAAINEYADLTDPQRGHLFLHAAEIGDTEGVNLLLDYGMINKFQVCGKNSSHFRALINGNKVIIRYLPSTAVTGLQSKSQSGRFEIDTSCNYSYDQFYYDLDEIRGCKVHEDKSTIADIQAEERRITQRKMKLKLSKLHQKLMDLCVGSSESQLASFAMQQSTSHKVWKEGIRVIRNIIDGHLPSRLHDIINCLLVADAMRSAAPNPNMVPSKREFVYDLDRWCALVDEKGLFWDITSHLWGITHPMENSDKPSFNEDVSLPEILAFFQELVINLVDQSSIDDNDRVAIYRYRSQYKREIWEETDYKLRRIEIIAVLMMGAIFGAILLYLCQFQYGSAVPLQHGSAVPRLHSSALWNKHGSVLTKILIRNSVILVTFLELSGFATILGNILLRLLREEDDAEIIQRESGCPQPTTNMPPPTLGAHTMTTYRSDDDVSNGSAGMSSTVAEGSLNSLSVPNIPVPSTSASSATAAGTGGYDELAHMQTLQDVQRL